MTAPENWAFQAIIDYCLSDTYIRAEVSRADFEALFNYDISTVNAVKKAVEYQRFDPRIIISVMINSAKAYMAGKPELVKWDLSNVSGDLKHEGGTEEFNIYTNQEKLLKDVTFLLTVFLPRNYHMDKIPKKARGGVSDILNMLKEKYNIHDTVHASGKSLCSREVTMPRIAGCFPTVVCKLYHYGVVKAIVGHETFPGDIKPRTRSICSLFLPSCCPKTIIEKEGQNIHGIMLWVAVKLDDVIHRRDKNFTGLRSIVSYYRTRFNSNATPEASRIWFFKNVGLLSPGDKTFSNEILALTVNCIASLDSMRVDDPDHQSFMVAVRNGNLDSL